MNHTKAFTLLEIIVALILISVLYLFTINNLNLDIEKETNNISLFNLKKELLNQKYNNNISIKCIEQDFKCFVFIDYKLEPNKIIKLFSTKPEIYEYSKDLIHKEFNILDLENLDSYDVIFEYSCNKHFKCTEEIVFLENKGYIFNDIHLHPIVVKSKIAIEDYFLEKIDEVKNAF